MSEKVLLQDGGYRVLERIDFDAKIAKEYKYYVVQTRWKRTCFFLAEQKEWVDYGDWPSWCYEPFGIPPPPRRDHLYKYRVKRKAMALLKHLINISYVN